MYVAGTRQEGNTGFFKTGEQVCVSMLTPLQLQQLPSDQYGTLSEVLALLGEKELTSSFAQGDEIMLRELLHEGDRITALFAPMMAGCPVWFSGEQGKAYCLQAVASFVFSQPEESRGRWWFFYKGTEDNPYTWGGIIVHNTGGAWVARDEPLHDPRGLTLNNGDRILFPA